MDTRHNGSAISTITATDGAGPRQIVRMIITSLAVPRGSIRIAAGAKRNVILPPATTMNVVVTSSAGAPAWATSVSVVADEDTIRA